MILHYSLAWIPMVVIAIINGLIRESTYGKHLSPLRAHQVSTVTSILALGLYIWGLSQLWGFSSAGQAFFVGLLWLGLTIIFEFGFGHYVVGHPWQQLLSN